MGQSSHILRKTGLISWILSSLFLLALALICVKVDGAPGLPGHLLGKVHYVKPGTSFDIDVNLDLNIFCRKADPKTLTNYFRTATLRIISTAEDIRLIHGHSEIDVYNQHVQSAKWYLWAANLLPWRVRETSFPTFNRSCIGICTKKPYHAMLITRPIDGWSLTTLVAGISLFFLAPSLSKSTLFFYGGGTVCGALAAALVVLFVVTRMLPRGRGYYAIIGAVWTMCLYFTGEIWKSIEQLMHEKLPYILVYLTSGALIAFLACYRFGPPSNPKTLDLIRWALQTAGVVLIHLSSDLVEVSTSIIVLTILYYNFSTKLFYELQRHWARRFPPKTKYLTEEEYIAQGATETNKELEKLREFCSSPDCNTWKLVNRLKNPRRFSEFMEGTSHLSDDEMMEFEVEVVKDSDGGEDQGLLTEDSDDSISVVPDPPRLKNALTNGNGNGCLTDDDSD